MPPLVLQSWCQNGSRLSLHAEMNHFSQPVICWLALKLVRPRSFRFLFVLNEMHSLICFATKKKKKTLDQWKFMIAMYLLITIGTFWIYLNEKKLLLSVLSLFETHVFPRSSQLLLGCIVRSVRNSKAANILQVLKVAWINLHFRIDKDLSEVPFVWTIL